MTHRGAPQALRREELELLEAAGHGTLALNSPDGWPLLRPVNFVLHDGRIYFHGSHDGEKMRALAEDPRSTFSVVMDYALIPSHFVHPRNACPATQYYKAVMIEGRTRIVSDPAEKARALQALMEKLQPEGGFETITPDDALYRKAVEETAVLAIEIERVASKFSFGQNAKGQKRSGIEAGLAQRGCPIDHATLQSMGEFKDRPRLIRADEAEQP